MASACRAFRIDSPRLTLWNRYFSWKYRPGMPRLPTVSNTPTNSISMSWWHHCGSNWTRPTSPFILRVFPLVPVLEQRGPEPGAVELAALHQAELVDHPRQAARGVRAAAEAEKVDGVTGLVIQREKPVRLDEIRLEPGAEGPADERAGAIALGADAGQIQDELQGPVAGLRDDPPGDPFDIRAEPVVRRHPCAVAAHDQSSPHPSPPGLSGAVSATPAVRPHPSSSNPPIRYISIGRRFGRSTYQLRIGRRFGRSLFNAV